MTGSKKRCTGPNILEMINFCRHNSVLFWCISRPSILFLISALGQSCVSIDLHYLRALFLPVLLADSFCREWLVLMWGYVRRQEEKIEKLYKERAGWSETSAWTFFSSHTCTICVWRDSYMYKVHDTTEGDSEAWLGQFSIFLNVYHEILGLQEQVWVEIAAISAGDWN